MTFRRLLNICILNSPSKYYSELNQLNEISYSIKMRFKRFDSHNKVYYLQIPHTIYKFKNNYYMYLANKRMDKSHFHYKIISTGIDVIKPVIDDSDIENELRLIRTLNISK